MLPLWICLWTLLNYMSYCLTWGKKKKRKKKERGTKKKKKKPPADFKPLQQVLLIFLDATGRRKLGFAFLPSYGFERMGTRSGSQFPGLCRPRSFVSCQAQIRHSVSRRPVWVNLRWAWSWRQAGSAPFCSATKSLGTRSWNLPLGVPAAAESSFQSSCPLFLTSTQLFT